MGYLQFHEPGVWSCGVLWSRIQCVMSTWDGVRNAKEADADEAQLHQSRIVQGIASEFTLFSRVLCSGRMFWKWKIILMIFFPQNKQFNWFIILFGGEVTFNSVWIGYCRQRGWGNAGNSTSGVHCIGDSVPCPREGREVSVQDVPAGFVTAGRFTGIKGEEEFIPWGYIKRLHPLFLAFQLLNHGNDF